MLRGVNTILLTGAGGFIGGALARRLRADGHEVCGLDLAETACGESPAVRISHDLTAPLPPAYLAGIDLVIHAAALAGVQASWDRPDAYWNVNAHGTALLRRACDQAGQPRVIHLSSISVYGEGLRLSENSATHPLSPYGRSKLAGEGAWAGYPCATVVRLSNVYGPGQRPDMAYATFIRAALDGRPIALRDGGRQLRTPTYIDDCVAGIVAAMQRGADGRTYNVAGPQDVRLAEVPVLLGDLLGCRIASRAVAPAAGDPRIATVLSDRATRELGYVPQTPVREGLAGQVAALAAAPPLRAATS